MQSKDQQKERLLNLTDVHNEEETRHTSSSTHPNTRRAQFKKQAAGGQTFMIEEQLKIEQSFKQEYLDTFAIEFKLPNSQIDQVLVYPKDPSISLIFINYFTNIEISKNASKVQVKGKNNNQEVENNGDSVRAANTYQFLNENEIFERSLTKGNREKNRKAAIIFAQEAPSTFKILYEKVLSYGNFFVYESSSKDKEFSIIKSDTIEDLLKLEPVAIIPKRTFDDISQFHFNQMNTCLAVIYHRYVEILDLPAIMEQESTSQSINSENITRIDIPSIYDYILALEFEPHTKEMVGKIALKPIDSDANVPTIHIAPFNKENLGYFLKGMITIKLDNLVEPPTSYMFKFTPALTHALIVTYYDQRESINDLQLNSAYVYEISSKFLQQVSQQSFIRYVSAIKNFDEQSSLYPFVALASSYADNKCYITLSEEQIIPIDFVFDQKKCKIVHVDARILQETEEICVRVAFIRDQEKLSYFTYIGKAQSQFDQLLFQTEYRHSDNLENKSQQNNNELQLSYREFQEYQVSNFCYPFIAYNDLSKQIRVISLDKSKEDLLIKMPQQKNWQNIKLIRITPNYQLFFLTEDVKEFFLYKYDLKSEQSLTNFEDPLIKISKADIGYGCMIEDFWVYSKESSELQRFLPVKNKFVDLIFYYKTAPDNKLNAIHFVQKIYHKEIIGEKIPKIHIKGNRVFYIREQQFLESFNWQTFNREIVNHFQEIDDCKILHFIQTNHRNHVWIFTVQDGGNYALKHLKFDKEFNKSQILEKIEIKDNELILQITQNLGNGFIEVLKEKSSKVLTIGDTIYCLESLEGNYGKDQEALKFTDILNIQDKNAQIMTEYPEVNAEFQKTLFIQKGTMSESKKGIVLPSLASEKMIKYDSSSLSKKQKEQTLSFIIQKQDQSQGLFRLNSRNKAYQILNVKGQIIKEGSFENVIEENNGSIVAFSHLYKMLAVLQQATNTISIYELFIDEQNFQQVTLTRKSTFVIPNLIGKKDKFKDFIGKRVQEKANLEYSKHIEYQINNKGDLIVVVQDKTFNDINRSNKILLYQYDPYVAPLEQKISFEIPNQSDLGIQLGNSDNQIFKSCVLTDSYIIGWFDTQCYLYSLNKGDTRLLSLNFDKRDGYQFLEVLQIENPIGKQEKELFLCRIENSMKSHMMIVWDDTSKQEECSCDVNSTSRVLFDDLGHAYVIDQQFGLIDLTEDSGCCKNLGFRGVLKPTSSDQVKLHTQSKNSQGQKVKILRETNTTSTEEKCPQQSIFGQKCEIERTSVIKKYFEFILLGSDLALPYSFLQLIINEKMQQIKLSSQGKQKLFIRCFENLASSLSTDSFTYQIRNWTVFHCFTSNFRELQIFCNIMTQKDPELLDMLLIQNEDLKTPLDLAIDAQNPRCVNYIMQLMSRNCSETFGRCTHLSKQHFANLIDYESFGEFMEAAFFQSEQYQQITSFASNQTERLEIKGILQAHTTVARDNQFNELLQDKQGTNERNVEVNALRADWILTSQEGHDFLEQLSQSEQMALFELESVRSIVLFQWKFYKKIICYKLFYPFLIYFCAFIISITYTYQQTNDSSVKDKNNLLNTLIVLCIVMPFQVYFLSIEIRQFFNQGRSYFREFWNLLDVGQLVAAFFISILMLTNSADNDSDNVNLVGSVAVIVLYLKFFYFLRIFESSAPYIRMIAQMTYDIRIFLYIFLLTVIGFGNGLYLLSLNNTDPDDQFIKNFLSGILYVYTMALGGFDTSQFGSKAVWMVWIIFLLSTMLIMVILLNLLIAIMGDTFGAVKESEEQSRIREYLRLILDNEFLVKRQQLFKDVKYIINIKLDNDKQNQQQSVVMGETSIDTQMSVDPQMLMKTLQSMQSRLDQMQKNQEDLHDLMFKHIQKKSEKLSSIKMSRPESTNLAETITGSDNYFAKNSQLQAKRSVMEYRKR